MSVRVVQLCQKTVGRGVSLVELELELQRLRIDYGAIDQVAIAPTAPGSQYLLEAIWIET